MMNFMTLYFLCLVKVTLKYMFLFFQKFGSAVSIDRNFCKALEENKEKVTKNWHKNPSIGGENIP